MYHKLPLLGTQTFVSLLLCLDGGAGEFFHFGSIIHKIGWIITKSASETTFTCWNSWTVVELSGHNPCICNVAILNFKWNLMISLTFIFVQVVPSIAIAFVTYEQVKDILGVEMRISD